MKYLSVFLTAVALLLFSFSLWGETTKSPADSTGSSRGSGGASTRDPAKNKPAPKAADQETGIIVGRLVSKSEYVVAWARVSLFPVDSNQPEAPAYTFVSGKDGTFMAERVKPGKYYVVVTHAGYKPVKPFIIKIYAGRRTVFDVILEERFFQVPTIIEVAERIPE